MAVAADATVAAYLALTGTEASSSQRAGRGGDSRLPDRWSLRGVILAAYRSVTYRKTSIPAAAKNAPPSIPRKSLSISSSPVASAATAIGVNAGRVRNAPTGDMANRRVTLRQRESKSYDTL